MYVFDWDNFIGLTTAIGSISTALTLFFLLQQRKDAIKPNLLIDYSNSFKTNPDEITQVHYWKDVNNKFDHPFFVLVNAGNGVAENIIITPIFNKEVFIKYLKDLDKGDFFVFEVHDSYMFIENIVTKTKTNFRFYINEVLDISTLIDLKTDNSHKAYVEISKSYTQIILALEFIINEYKIGNFYKITDFPKLHYTINYQDGLGNSYISKYEVILERLSEVSIYFKKVST